MAAPVFNGLDNNPTYTENSSAVLLDNNASITDADIGASTPYTGATLTLARSAGTNVEDLFSGAPLSDGQVTVSGTIEDPESPGNFIVVEIIIGTYTNDDGTLVITLMIRRPVIASPMCCDSSPTRMQATRRRRRLWSVTPSTMATSRPAASR